MRQLSNLSPNPKSPFPPWHPLWLYEDHNIAILMSSSRLTLCLCWELLSMKEASSNKTQRLKVTQYDPLYQLSTKRWTARGRTWMSPTCSRRTLSKKCFKCLSNSWAFPYWSLWSSFNTKHQENSDFLFQRSFEHLMVLFRFFYPPKQSDTSYLSSWNI